MNYILQFSFDINYKDVLNLNLCGQDWTQDDFQVLQFSIIKRHNDCLSNTKLYI